MKNNIKELLDGRTIKWLADKTGIHRNTLTSYIKGAEPTLGNAYKISKAFDKTVYDIWPDN